MDVASVEARLPPELVEWFCKDIDEGDAPELHIAGLREGDVQRLFAAISEKTQRWEASTFWVESLEREVSIQERPDVADLVAAGDAPSVCLSAADLTVDDITLPTVGMFVLSDAIEFFWWPPDGQWTREKAAAFLALLASLASLAPNATLEPDHRYHPDSRRRYGELLRTALGDDAPIHT